MADGAAAGMEAVPVLVGSTGVVEAFTAVVMAAGIATIINRRFITAGFILSMLPRAAALSGLITDPDGYARGIIGITGITAGIFHSIITGITAGTTITGIITTGIIATSGERANPRLPDGVDSAVSPV